MHLRLGLLAALLTFGYAACENGASTSGDGGGGGDATQEESATPTAEQQSSTSAIPEIGDAKPEDHPLLHPDQLTEKAPDQYNVKFETSKGDFTLEIHRDWAPQGADRFYNLVKNGFYDGVVFFRVIKAPRPFMVQFGINPDPAVNSKWQTAKIPDDEVKESNKPGYISFATSGPNSRTTQVFINYNDNSRLDQMGFAPFGKVSEGMDVVESIEGKYGEGFPQGRGPSQGRIQSQGNAYLRANFPDMDFVEKATVVE